MTPKQPSDPDTKKQPMFLRSRAPIGPKKPAVLMIDNLKMVAKAALILASHYTPMTLGRLNLMFVSHSAMYSVLFNFRDTANFRSLIFTFYPCPSLVKENAWTLLLPDWFVFWLLAMDVLRLNKIFVWPRSEIPEMKDELPIESLIVLSLFQDSPMNQKRATKWDLGDTVLKPFKLTLSEGSYRLVDRALNMNAENLEIDVYTSNFAPISKLILPKPSGLVADRMKNLCVRYSMSPYRPAFDKFPHEHLRAMVDYFLTCCTTLEKLFIKIEFGYSFRDVAFEPFVQQIEAPTEKLKS